MAAGPVPGSLCEHGGTTDAAQFESESQTNLVLHSPLCGKLIPNLTL